MAVLSILRYPDSLLRRACEPVSSFDERLWRLVADLQDTMRSVDGFGLAANQVGATASSCSEPNG
jgi:peptide deformylase